jgi:3-oxoacyl-[acyl-carrier protein] reductase
MEFKTDPAGHPMIITGVCGDVGNQLAAHFLKMGYRVLGLDIVPEALPVLVSYEKFTFVSCDLTKPADVDLAVERFVSQHGPIRIVINNAGVILNAPVVALVDGKMMGHNSADWEKVLSSSLSSAFYVTTACVKYMISDRSGGVVINISSISANGNPGQSAYSAAKGGLNSMTFAQAKELGPMGIRFVAIAPGFLDTGSTRRAMTEPALKKINQSIPLRRLGKVEELIHAIQFVMDNPYYTGTLLELDGGLTL